MQPDASGSATAHLSMRGRVAIVAASLFMVALVGYADGRSSAYIAFSIFYVVPIALAAWFGNRVLGVIVAVAGGIAGLAADVWSIGAQSVYAYTNLALRLMLFVLIAVLVSKLRVMIGREQAVAAREHEAAESLREIDEMRLLLMRSVATDAREPLADIYARVVTLGFDMQKLSTEESREVLNEIADASRRLSALVNTLLPDTAQDRPNDRRLASTS